MNSEKAFTLIELMVSIVVIAILSTSLLAIVNQNKQRTRAQDSVNLANLEKAASAIEAHYYSEGFYPKTSDSGNPLENEENIVLGNYLTATWPEDFMYIYDSSTNGYDFAIVVARQNEEDGYYKYISSRAAILKCDSETSNIDTNVTSCNVIGEE